MLARCLIQPLRTSSLLLNRSPARSVLVVRDNLRNQLAKERKFTTGQPRANKDRKSNNYEKLRERLSQRTKFEVQSLEEFENEIAQLGLVQKFKKIVSEYYHIILAVHAATSACWIALTFLIKYQFNITPEPLIKSLEKWNVPQFFLAPLKNPWLEAIAVPYFLYKCLTPFRYYSTVVITMMAIRRLMPRGIISPRPTPKIIQKIYGTYKKIEKKKD